MRRKTSALIGLEHVVPPTVLGHNGQIRIQDAGRIIHIYELRLWRANTMSTADIGGTIHPAVSGWVHITHCYEANVVVTEIVATGQCDGRGLRHARGRSLVHPVACLNVVLRSGGTR